MNLYLVQDNDRPMWVAAKSWQEALDKWTEVIARENDLPTNDVDGPSGIQKVCDEGEFLP